MLASLKFHFKDFLHKCQKIRSHVRHKTQLLNKFSEDFNL